MIEKSNVIEVIKNLSNLNYKKNYSGEYHEALDDLLDCILPMEEIIGLTEQEFSVVIFGLGFASKYVNDKVIESILSKIKEYKM